jgi:hypothetical protein
VSQSFLAYRTDEALDHGKRDIGLEQREANLAQRVLDVAFGKTRFAAQRLHQAAESLGQQIEHRGESFGKLPGAGNDRSLV